MKTGNSNDGDDINIAEVSKAAIHAFCIKNGGCQAGELFIRASMVRSEEALLLSNVAMSALVAHGMKVASHCYDRVQYCSRCTWLHCWVKNGTVDCIGIGRRFILD